MQDSWEIAMLDACGASEAVLLDGWVAIPGDLEAELLCGWEAQVVCEAMMLDCPEEIEGFCGAEGCRCCDDCWILAVVQKSGLQCM